MWAKRKFVGGFRFLHHFAQCFSVADQKCTIIAAQPAGATAVLIINNMELGKPNVTATFTLDEIRFNASSTGAKVFDIWTQSLVGSIPAGATSYETISFGPHDSVFLLLEPKA